MDGIRSGHNCRDFLKVSATFVEVVGGAPVGKIMERRVCFCVSTCREESRATLFAASANIHIQIFFDVFTWADNKAGSFF